MKKFICLTFFLVLVVTSAATVSAAPDLSGYWIGFGYSFKAQQSGNSITLIATDGDIKGKVSLEGIITGNTVEGRQIMIAKGCPNLEKYVPAKGAISSNGNSITITYKNLEFDPSRCVNVPGSEFEETGSYTKVGSPPAPTTPSHPAQRPQPTQTPQIKKATPVPTATSIPSDKSGDQLPAKQGQNPDLVNKSSQDGNPFSIFGFNPLETWRNIQGLLDIPEGLNSLVQTAEFLSSPRDIEIQVPDPEISLDPEGKRWDFLPGYIPHESIYLGNTMRISEGTKVSAGGVNQGGDKKLLNLEEGEVEVIKNEPDVTDSEYDGIKTPNATVLSVQTHYWVSYNKKKDETTVAVYEGQVEVKSKDGKTTTVSPDGDKPGVVMVTQKLSVTKLAIVGVVLALVIGSAILILRRKFAPKGFGKKKR